MVTRNRKLHFVNYAKILWDKLKFPFGQLFTVAFLW